MEHLITIEIFGQPFSFKADIDSHRAKEVADYLVNQISQVESQQTEKSSNISKLAIMILAALNIANENIELKKEQARFLEELFDRSSRLSTKLDDYVR